MPKIHTRKEFTERRKELRKNSTPEEVLMWNQLRNKKLGVRFERQHSIGPYIVDFYCAKKKLVVEIDGNQHLQNQTYDLERAQYLETLGYKVLRFWNSEINKNIREALQKIKDRLTSY